MGEQNFGEIMGRAKITEPDLYKDMRQAVDNLDSKMDFFHRMTSEEAIALRIAEASCGSKWNQAHGTKLADMKAADVVNHIKSKHVCDKKAKTKIFRALEDGEPEAAIAAMGDRYVITL